MNVNILPEHIMLFLNIALFIAQVAAYVLYFRHVMVKNHRVIEVNLNTISAVTNMTKALNKAIDRNMIDRAVAESRETEDFNLSELP